jgi:hypothetical protein
MDLIRLFAHSMDGEEVSDATVDGWLREAAASAQRLRSLLDDGSSFAGDTERLRPALTTEDFKKAFGLAFEQHGLRLQEARNSAHKFVRGVFNFQLPDAFRKPVISSQRTCHVVCDREIDSVAKRDASSRGTAGFSLLLVAHLET